jgi:drug/metabolite transporter (DMT)-like permease
MNVRFVILLIVAMVSWGFAWPIAKLIANLVPIHVLVFWRFLMTFVSVIPLMIFLKIPFTLKSGKDYFDVLVGGIIYTLYNQFFFLGLENGLPGAGGVLVTTLNPIFTFFVVALNLRRGITKRQSIGLLFGLVGGMTILKVWEISFDSLVQSGNLFFLLCALTWAVLSLNSQKSGKSMSPIAYSLYVYAVGTIVELIFSYNDDKFMLVWSLGAGFWWSVFYLAVVSTTFGTTVYFYAATRLGSDIASSFIFIVPLSAYVSSILIVDEAIQVPVLIGGAFAVIAVYLINSGKKHLKNEVVPDA